jgi:cobalt-zinc-cadmium efflux system outer membrane protein
VIQADENLSLARDTLRTFEELAAMNDARVQAGAAAQYDATRTRVAMLQFRANVTRAELQWRTSALRLRQLLGRPASADPIAVAAPATLSASLASAPAVLEETAVQSRADLRAARMTQARTVADLKLQLAVGKVDFTYGAEYRRQAGPIGLSNSLGVFFSAPLPFANRNQGEIARAGAEGQQADRTTAALEASVRADVRIAFDAYSSSAGLVASIERDLLGPARSARDIAAYSYKAGGTTLVDLIDSQRAFNDAMQSYYDARAEYRRAIAHLNSAVGTEVTK